MANEATSNLKRCVKEYRELDNEIRELNKEVYAKRTDRKVIEMEMAEIVALPQFNGIDKLKFDDDGSMIKIGRPGTYNKPWSLSKKELETFLNTYFAMFANPTAAGCIKYIIEERQKALVGKEFDFTRVIPDE